jgi:hypothetical protein
MIPWHLLKAPTIDLMFELIKCAIASLKYHISRPSCQIDKDLLSRMLSTAHFYPAFSLSQKQHFSHDKVFSIQMVLFNYYRNNYWKLKHSLLILKKLR